MKTLQDLFYNTQQWKNKTAFVYRTGTRRIVFSYGDFYRLSLQAAAWLRDMGINKGDRVVIWAPNSPWWAVAFFGVILRGGIVVPVDFASGKERAEKIAGLTESKLIFQSQYKLDKLNTANTILIEDLQFLIENIRSTTNKVLIAEDDIAELIYTSGTTGDPKGVVLTHKNLIANLLQANQRIFVVSEKWNFLSLLPLSHMFEQTCGFFTPLLDGAATVYIRTLKPSAIMEALSEEDIYVAIAVPRLLQALKNSIERELEKKPIIKYFNFLVKYGVRREFGKNFWFFVSGGSALDTEVGKFWQHLGYPVIEGYGLTECSPILATNFVGEQRFGSVGKPLSGVQIKIQGKEILAKGENIFKGYWNNPEASRDVFTQDGWFKTGDLGEIAKDGWINIKGRIKDMIVTGAGVNIYPEDIEAVLNKIFGVKESCVIGKRGTGGEEVHAVLILSGEQEAKNIIDLANQKLDPQQQISGFSLWPELEFPKTTTLKTQKFIVWKKINEQQGPGAGASGDRLINLISHVIGKNPADVRENSILVRDLALTSVARLELVNYLEQEFRLDMEDTDILSSTTVGDLRKFIAKGERKTVKDLLPFWPNKNFGKVVKCLVNWLINYPIFFSFVKLQKKGLENLQSLNSPTLFVSNHISYFDHPTIVFSLPSKLRYRIATAAMEEFFYPDRNVNIFKRWWKRFTYYYGITVLNLFPLPQSKGFRKNLEFMGKLIDNNVNILIFPEGERSYDGNMLPFMDGLGIIVKELQVPVLPIKIEGIEKVFPRGAAMPKRGKVTVTFGKPHFFGQESPSQIVEISKKLIMEL